MDDITIKFTGLNLRMLNAIVKYMMWIDYKYKSGDCEHLNVDGIINEIMDEALKKRIKEIAKRHSFLGTSDFIELIEKCKDGEEVNTIIRDSERNYIGSTHARVLSYIPFEDAQRNLPLK